ncbi:hypothetical protein L4C33_19855 [Vibrio makurazakiensis]|uniref:hypothetical protein n=1 Tax=Vibrio makurazakiensis TaxID=2910250 RepID=UPI003D1044A8
MKSTETKHELRLIVIAIICALLLVLGHVILAKAFSEFAWTEYTVAAIPFVMFALCLGAVRYAEKQELN